MKWGWLAIGSLAGGFGRYFLAGFVYNILGTSFPYGTLVVNISGCFLIGLFNALAEEKFLLGPQGRLLLMTGFCGAYTTFSTFILETMNLLKDGEVLRASVNLGGSILLGGAFFILAEYIARAI